MACIANMAAWSKRIDPAAFQLLSLGGAVVARSSGIGLKLWLVQDEVDRRWLATVASARRRMECSQRVCRGVRLAALVGRARMSVGFGGQHLGR